MSFITAPSKHETLSQCCFNVGPPSLTLGQHYTIIGSTSRACLKLKLGIDAIPIPRKRYPKLTLIWATTQSKTHVKVALFLGSGGNIWYGLLTLKVLDYRSQILTYLKLCPAAAIHNFKSVKITKMWNFKLKTYTNLVNLMFISRRMKIHIEWKFTLNQNSLSENSHRVKIDIE